MEPGEAAWMCMRPAERWKASRALLRHYLDIGGSLDPDPDPQCPFWSRTRSLRPRRAGGSAPTAASKVTESGTADPVQHILATFHIHKGERPAHGRPSVHPVRGRPSSARTWISRSWPAWVSSHEQEQAWRACLGYGALASARRQAQCNAWQAKPISSVSISRAARGIVTVTKNSLVSTAWCLAAPGRWPRRPGPVE